MRPAFFCSGVSALMLQILWTRRMAFAYGGTVEAAAIVLAIFFAGLAAGNALASWRLPRVRRPLLGYAGCELVVALCVPLAWVHTPAAVALAATAMGATLPCGAEALGRAQTEASWRGTTGLYAINTAGAVFGAVAAGMILPPMTGQRGAELIAGGIAVAVAVAMALAAKPQAALPRTGGASAKFGPAALAAFSGFGVMSLEVLWTRMYGLVLQNSVYTFSAIVVVVLTALAAGAALSHRMEPRVAAALGLALAGAGVFAGRELFLVWTGLERFGLDLSFGRYIGATLALVAATAGLPALAAGMVLPATWRMARPAEEGRPLGALVAANTVGGVAGALVAAFVAIPRAGLWWSLAGVAAAYLLAVAAIRPRWSIAAIPLAAAGIVLSLQDRVMQRTQPGEQLIVLRETPAGGVAVLAGSGHKRMVLDNTYTLGGTRSAKRERRQGLIPQLLHPNPRDVAFIGIGTGLSVTGVPEVDSIDAIEIVPEVTRLAREQFGLADDRLRTIDGDGRLVLARSQRRYDVIISDLFVPWHAGTGHLYTLDHFETVRARLTPGGIFALWLPMWQMGRTEFEIIARTFVDVFPHTELWRANFHPQTPVAGLIGWTAPPSHGDVALRLPGGDPLLEETDSFWMLQVGVVRRSEGPINTLDLPLIEFGAPRSKARVTHREWLDVCRRTDWGGAANRDAGMALYEALVRANEGDGAGAEAAFGRAQELAPRSRFLDAVLAGGVGAVDP